MGAARPGAGGRLMLDARSRAARSCVVGDCVVGGCVVADWAVGPRQGAAR